VVPKESAVRHPDRKKRKVRRKDMVSKN